MTKIILLVLISLSNLVLIAQENDLALKKNQIHISTGFSNHITQDDIVSPFIYKGTKMPIWLIYKHHGNNYVHNISAYYDRLDLESRITDKSSSSSHYSKNTNGYFSYSVVRKIYSMNEFKSDIYVGGKLKSYINYRNHYYTNYDQTTIGEQSTSLDINLSLIKKYSPQNDLISYSFSFPIVSYVLMANMFNVNVCDQINNVDPFKNLMVQLIKNGDFIFINKLFEFQSELSIYKSMNNFLALGINHYIHYYSFEKHPDNRRTKYLNNQFLLNFIIKF